MSPRSGLGGAAALKAAVRGGSGSFRHASRPRGVPTTAAPRAPATARSRGVPTKTVAPRAPATAPRGSVQRSTPRPHSIDGSRFAPRNPAPKQPGAQRSTTRTDSGSTQPSLAATRKTRGGSQREVENARGDQTPRASGRVGDVISDSTMREASRGRASRAGTDQRTRPDAQKAAPRESDSGSDAAARDNKAGLRNRL